MLTSLNSANLNDAYHNVYWRLRQAGIELEVHRKRVKNINFRLKPNLLMVSAPTRISHSQLASAIERRLAWVITHHPKVLAQHQKRLNQQSDLLAQAVSLWGEVQPVVMGEKERLTWYRQSLSEIMPELFAKWQPIVGQEAHEQRIKKMSTRWGSCNVKARRIWLSVYLPAYPVECTEYVIVHELCHLHHANHSPAFWREVKRAMPDYRRWHDLLAGKGDSEQPLAID